MVNRDIYFFYRYKFYTCRQDIYDDKTVLITLEKAKEKQCKCKIMEVDRVFTKAFQSITLDMNTYMRKIIEQIDGRYNYGIEFVGDINYIEMEVKRLYKKRIVLKK